MATSPLSLSHQLGGSSDLRLNLPTTIKTNPFEEESELDSSGDDEKVKDSDPLMRMPSTNNALSRNKFLPKLALNFDQDYITIANEKDESGDEVDDSTSQLKPFDSFKVLLILSVSFMLILSMYVFADLHVTRGRLRKLEHRLFILEGRGGDKISGSAPIFQDQPPELQEVQAQEEEANTTMNMTLFPDPDTAPEFPSSSPHSNSNPEGTPESPNLQEKDTETNGKEEECMRTNATKPVSTYEDPQDAPSTEDEVKESEDEQSEDFQAEKGDHLKGEDVIINEIKEQELNTPVDKEEVKAEGISDSNPTSHFHLCYELKLGSGDCETLKRMKTGKVGLSSDSEDPLMQEEDEVEMSSEDTIVPEETAVEPETELEEDLNKEVSTTDLSLVPPVQLGDEEFNLADWLLDITKYFSIFYWFD